MVVKFFGIKSIPDICTLEHGFANTESIFGAVIHKPVSIGVSNIGFAVAFIQHGDFHVVGRIVIVYIVYGVLISLEVINIISSGYYIITGSSIGGSTEVNLGCFTIGEYGYGNK